MKNWKENNFKNDYSFIWKWVDKIYKVLVLYYE